MRGASVATAKRPRSAHVALCGDDWGVLTYCGKRLAEYRLLPDDAGLPGCAECESEYELAVAEDEKRKREREAFWAQEVLKVQRTGVESEWLSGAGVVRLTADGIFKPLPPP